MEYQRFKHFVIGSTCSVDGCNSPAEYEVILYDYYVELHETFYKQDYTCPFLCERHMIENEEKAEGIRNPRGYVIYPYSNGHGARGYSKYHPIKDVYPQFFDRAEIENNRELQIDLKEINDELIGYLAIHPEFMRELHPSKFEELIAELFRAKGYDVTLTKKTRDGGKDVIALYKGPFGHQMFIVECKRFKETNKVGVEVVRALYGVKVAENYNQAIIATTSSFTKDAELFVKPLRLQLELKDFNDIHSWIKEYKK